MTAMPQPRTGKPSWHRHSADEIIQIIGLAALCLLLATGPARAQQELTPAQQKAADLRLPDLDRSELLPERRTPTEVLLNERNPFGSLALPPPEEKDVAPIEMETEEMKIRRILGSLRVSGLTGDPGAGYTVLLGPLLLRTGETLPRLFADQAELLRVESVTDHDVVFTFVEKDQSLPPRTISFNFDLRPRVRSVLAGELMKKVVTFDKRGRMDMKPLPFGSAEVISDALDKQNVESLVERRFEMMGDTISAPKENETESATAK